MRSESLAQIVAAMPPNQRREFERLNPVRAGAEPSCASAQHGHGPTSAAKPRRGRMNKTEAMYARELEVRQSGGFVAWWGFEALKFRLADGAYYTPDFTVILPDGAVEIIEIKGFLREAAGVRFRVAAEMFPWADWRMIRRVKGGWETVIGDTPRVAVAVEGGGE